MIRRGATLLVVGVLAIVLLAPAASGAEASAGQEGPASAGPVSFTAVLDGQHTDEAFGRDPVQLDAGKVGRLALEITNAGVDPVTVGFLRLDGEVLGMTFLRYDLALGLTVDAGTTEALTVPLDFFGLDEAATGYLGGALVLFDADRNELSRASFPLDVRGGARSTLARFSFVILVVAAISVLLIARNIGRRKLPPNRLIRGLQFAMAGATLGLTISLAVSTLRIAVTSSDTWVSVLVTTAVVGFVLGVLAPGPAVDDDEVLLAELERLSGLPRVSTD